MKGFRTYEIFRADDLKRVQKLVDAIVYRQIWVEIIPSQPGKSDVVVHLRQGDNRQYRDMLDICIKQEISFDIQNYRKENENE
jgi:hypothetical protein